MAGGGKRKLERADDDDEEDFPRGGKQALSAAEIQEARAEAEAEFNRENENLGKKTKKKKRKVEEDPEEETLLLSGNARKSVELLKFRKLCSGMRLWGAVSGINKTDLSISLPNGLHGFVKVDEAFPEYTPDLSDDKGKCHLLLEELFHVGQYVSCTLLNLEETKGDGQKKQPRRAVLSLLPRHFNEGMTMDTIYVGQLMISSVKSIEDHGYVLSFGLPEMSGFLLHKDHQGEKLRVGEIMQSCVSAIDKKRGVINLTTMQLSSAMKEHENLSLGTLVPGALVNGCVQAVMRNGVLLSFLTYFTGIVDIFHLQSVLSSKDWAQDYTEGKRFKARIIFIDARTKRIRLSLRSHLVDAEIVVPSLNRGDVIEAARIKRVDPAIGLLLELPATPHVAGYVNHADVSDVNVDKLEKKFKDGQRVKARIIGFRLMDGMATLTLKESMVKGVVNKLDLKPGALVHGVITRVEACGALVSLGGVKGLCPVQHMSEYNRLKPSSKFEVGKKMKFRVLQYDHEKKKLSLTFKKSLVSSKLPLITAYEDAVDGLVTHGWIQGISNIGCFMEFYNHVKGLVHRSELGIGPDTPIEAAFHVGQVVKCRVLESDLSKRRLSLSFNMSLRPGVKPGSVVSAVITQMGSSQIELQVNDDIASTMSYEHLSDTPVHAEQMRSLLKPGFKFDRLLVLGWEHSKLVLTAKYSLIDAAESLPSSIHQLSPMAVLPGYISVIHDKYCLVSFLDDVTGLVPIGNASDGYLEDLSQVFFVGQSVRAQVLEVDSENEKFVLSLKQSACFSTDVSLIQGYFLEEELIAKLKEKEGLDWGNKLQIGELVEADVQEVKDYGIILNLKDNADVVGFATHYQSDSPVEVGAAVKACILDVVKTDGIVDLSLQKKMLKFKKTKAVLQLHQRVEVVVELVKDEYLVLSLPKFGNSIGFASTRDYNIRVLRPHDHYSPGQKFSATIYSFGSESVGERTLLLLADTKPTFFTYVKNDIGAIIEGQIQEISSLHMIIQAGINLRGNVHITEVVDHYEEGNPLRKYNAGQTVRAKILSKRKTSRKHGNAPTLDLSLRPSELTGNDSARSVITFETVTIGQTVVGYVQEVKENWAWLVLSPHLRGRLFILDSSDDPSELERFQERFKVGDAFQCHIRSVNHEKKQVDLSLRPKDEDFKKGDLLGGRITRVRPGDGGLTVQVGWETFGRVHVTHLGDTWMDDPASLFTEGKFVRCRVLDLKPTLKGTKALELSLRPSLGGYGGFESLPSYQTLERKSNACIVNSVSELQQDMQVQGFVKDVTEKGCFVILSPSVDARILLKNLSSSFVQNPAEMFPAGKLVSGRILSVRPLSGHVEMSLTTSQESSSWKTFCAGDIVSGRIRSIEAFGMFVALADSDVVGLCHVSEVSDDFIQDLPTLYKVGQRVQVKILKVDAETKRISLGMKASFLTPDDGLETMDEEPVAEEPSTANVLMETDEKEEDYLDLDTEATPMATDVDPLEVNLEEDVEDKVPVEDEKPPTAEESKKKTKKEKKRLKEQREAAVRAAEEKFLQKDQPPETEDDFERLVAASPNSSYVWIKYMAYWLRLADPDKARAVADRALETINYREEMEKMNIWTAYINLENSYAPSPREAVSALFERAMKYCDPKKLHLSLLGVYESTNQHEMTDALMKSMTRKFKTSTKVWLRHVSNLLGRGLSDKARKAFEQACVALPRHKHIKFISRAAILEFKSGSPERAREIFDGVLRNYPKKTDLWSVYLDQEIRLGDTAIVRNLFERATCLDLPAKKMKFLFKKYLDFEKGQGDETRIEHVKTKAMEFVEAKAG
ncbi:hypothetical protein SELMODRAFT_451253 [Selaginella moellendorffii]|uniref:Uncharacterized protein RRP5-1 n=1 Tax=Selaginella moellendorffii TaxID=88036 RepID=D8RLQ0_SELML|nr:rRNA biogenesis protein RRP5 [Selaginella moellendorffii]EFJ26760.1 hypothetical protein SELMODRAFT_451253 [Selaginella moellendorffii]|eukprot:XP_002971843.1 rRNA biogenesis protein RRP5 [Selaginella moellendorffii]